MIKQPFHSASLGLERDHLNLTIFESFLSQLKAPVKQSTVDVDARVNITYVCRNQVIHDQVTISLANAGYDRGNIRIRNGANLNGDDFQMALVANESKYKIEGSTLVIESRSSKMGEFRIELTEVAPSQN